MKLDFSDVEDLEDFEFVYEEADEEAMKAVSELLGHHRTDKALMSAYLGASPL